MANEPNYEDLNNVTPVIFRWWPEIEGVIALFPTEVADCYGLYCESFDFHDGWQHASASVMISMTRPAKPEEYAAIKEVLETKHNMYLKVYQRRTPQMYAKFRENYLAWRNSPTP